MTTDLGGASYLEIVYCSLDCCFVIVVSKESKVKCQFNKLSNLFLYHVMCTKNGLRNAAFGIHKHISNKKCTKREALDINFMVFKFLQTELFYRKKNLLNRTSQRVFLPF